MHTVARSFWLTLLLLVFTATLAAAGDVQVNGYTRKNGTYVAPYTRSAPNNTRSDNYGRPSSNFGGGSRGLYGGGAPSQRDYDNDGLTNQYDYDDDNDGRSDDYE